MVLFLTGMPGTGKSYWLRHFANALSLPGIDLDDFLEQSFGQAVPEMIARGIPYFREKEAEALSAILQNQANLVLATGGGTPCYGNNLEVMKSAGIVIHIFSPIDVLEERILNVEQQRPLLNSKNKESLYKGLSETFHKRKPFYEQADITFEPGRDTLEEILQLIKLFQQKNAKRYV